MIEREGTGVVVANASGVPGSAGRMTDELKLPLYVLVDNDPWGFYIYSVMKQGSINLAYESMRMAVPDARFVGLSSFDKVQYQLPSNVAIKMEDRDNSRVPYKLDFCAAVFERIEQLKRRGPVFVAGDYNTAVEAIEQHGDEHRDAGALEVAVDGVLGPDIAQAVRVLPPTDLAGIVVG